MDSTKVFIDTDNEITFILEKVLSAKSERVSLVIPDRASIFSSVTGLKLIKRVVDKSNKLLILVTLDEQGAELSRNAGLHVVSRVGEINEHVWEKTLKEKFEIKKRDSRSHYMPDSIAKETQAVDETKISSVTAFVDISAPANEAEDETYDKQEEPMHELQEMHFEEEEAVLDVPQVRINIDREELEKADEELPEYQETIPEIEEPKKPSFLSREAAKVPTLKSFDEPEMSDLLHNEEHVEDIAPTMHNDKSSYQPMEQENHENVRKRKASTRSSSISNLSFSVGKDIESEKKK